MENATKALLMAGGVLIAIMVMSFMVLVLRQGSKMSAEYDAQQSDNAVATFNNKFEVYDKNNNNFFNVITVANLAYDINQKNGYDANNCVKVYLKGKDMDGRDSTYSILPIEKLPKNYFFKGEEAKEDSETVYIYDSLVSLYGAKQEGDSTKYKYSFKCDEIGYNSVTGKVNKISFTAVEN